MAKSNLTAAARKKGQQKRKSIADLTLNMALRDNDNAKTVTKTIKVREVVPTSGKLKKSMATYRKEAEKVVNKAEIEAQRRKNVDAAEKRKAARAATLKKEYEKGFKAGGKTCGK